METRHRKPNKVLADKIGNAVSGLQKIVSSDIFVNTSGENSVYHFKGNLMKESAKILFYFDLVLAIVHLLSVATAFTIFWFFTTKISVSILTIDPTLFDGVTFLVTLQELGTLNIAILLFLPTLLASLVNFAKVWSIPYSDLQNFTGPDNEFKGWGMYLETIKAGVLTYNWLYLFPAIGALTFTIGSLCGITNIFTLILLVACIWSVIWSGWLHEAQNASLDDINRSEIEKAVSNSEFLSSLVQWKYWDAFIFGGAIHIFYWITIFAYFGLMAKSSTSALSWWQWAVPFVSIFFYVCYVISLALYTNVTDTGITTTGNVVDLRFQRHVNKEIWQNIFIALCTQSVLWLTFGGMIAA